MIKIQEKGFLVIIKLICKLTRMDYTYNKNFNFNFDKSKVNFANLFQAGSFGSIYEHKDDERLVFKHMMPKNLGQTLHYIKEIILGMSCNHSFILSVEGFGLETGENKWNLYIKMPKMVKSLRERIENDDLSDIEKISYFYDLTLGLDYLHKKGIAHNDIKPENILIDSNDKIKIADLGLAEYIEDELPNKDDRKGTFKYFAPEYGKDLVKEELFMTDIWSLGVVIAELYKVEPTKTKNEQVEAYYADQLKEKLNDKVIDNEVIFELLTNILKYKPKERCTLKTIRDYLESNFPFLREESEKIRKVADQNQDMKYINSISIQQDLEKTKKNLEKGFGYYFNFTREGEQGIKIEINNRQRENEKTLLKGLMQKITELKQDIHNEKLRDFAQGFLQFSQNTNDMVKNLSSALDLHLKKLEHLSIDFSGCNQINDEAMVDFFSKKVGSAINNLEQLSVNLSLCKQLTGKSVEGVAKEIISQNKFNGIKNFCFDFSWNKVDTSAIRSLGDSIKENLKELSYLSLNFSSCDQISGEAMEDFVKNIGKKPLKFLFINFSWNKNVSDKTVQEITEQIQKNFQDLQNLSLEFYCCCNITELSIKESVDQISQLQQLTKLYLNFSNCEKISEKVLSALIQSQDKLEKLENLEELLMVLSSQLITKKVTEELTTHLRTILSKCKIIKVS